MSVDRKNIRIPYNGPIYPKGGVYGPITNPYSEDIRTIFLMLSQGIKVIEVFPDGKEIQLTTSNFDKDLSKKEEKPIEVKKNEIKVSVEPITTVPVRNIKVQLATENNNKTNEQKSQFINKKNIQPDKLESK
jgi:hypothetical protein